MDNIILIGYGGHAKSVVDCIRRTGSYTIIGYTDREDWHSSVPYLGTDDVLPEYLKKGYNKVVICIGYLGKESIREHLYENLKNIGFEFPVIVDPTAVISDSAIIGEGSFVGKGAIINAEAQIGKMCIINTKAIVEHESKVGDFTHVAVGAVLCGQVEVGKAALVGANATVIQCRKVRERQIVPAGAVIR